MLIARRDEIHLWCAHCDDRIDAALSARYRSLLSQEEAAQEQRFHTPALQRQFLLTRALVRTVLSRYAPIEPALWRFEKDRFGRPRVLNAEAAGVIFNLSHTDEVVVLGITAESALGIDVERITERTPALGLAERYFAPAELRDLRALPPAAQLGRFFEYWTLKEAYIKARSQGLSVPLDRFSFSLHRAGVTGSLTFSIDPTLGDDAGRWRFWLLGLDSDNMGAVCAERHAESRQTLVANEILPLVAERTLTLRVTAAT